MFLSQDGVVLSTTLRALEELDILEPSFTGDRSLAELYPELTDPGFGSLRVAVRCLVSVGWLADEPTLNPKTTVLRWTDAGRLAARHRDSYVAGGRLLAGFGSSADDAWSRPWPAAQIEAFAALVDRACDRWRLDPELPAPLASLVTAHLDAALIVPAMLWLHETDRLPEEGPSLPEGGAGPEIGRLLEAVDWIERPGGTWSGTGRLARAFALNFGGVATYLPLLARLPELYRGEMMVAPDPGGDSTEWHVHRALNLKISANAHRRYFADADAIFLDLFDRPADRPEFIADMGCGDGSWLVHLHELLSERPPAQGAPRSEPPLMVGMDSSPTALERARRQLDAAGVPSLLLRGDVTDPERVSASLAEHGLKMEDGLHIRAFLDHDRGYLGAGAGLPVPGWTSGAYIDEEGRPLEAAAVERDLVAHLKRWAELIGRHGLVVLEAHCVAPRIASRHLGALHSVAFDAHQAYSQQYPIDHAAFLRCCREAGLPPEGRYERRYPSSRPYVTVSLNRLMPAGPEAPLPALDRRTSREDTWEPDPDADLEDGRALHEMLFAGGDIRYPQMWCTAPTGFVVGGALEAIEARLANARGDEAIRILDYGAGTGTATIELLKACRERGIAERLKRSGAALEIHLVDLPSSWFAQAFSLLRGCAWTRFHSLRADDGSFRPLREVTAGHVIDAVMANMVFHLIPPRALPRAAGELASVTAPGGRLLWSAPDLGPPGRWSVLLHDPNRALRERWLELLADAGGDGPRRAREAAGTARARLDPGAQRAAQDRADRRILPRPLAAAVVAALEPHFEGETESRAYEMLAEEILRGLLVPSNQAEYLPEISDRTAREEVISELMLEEILPAMQRGPAGTALGVNLHWTLGAYTRRP